jgi:hypothetical protein
VGVPELATGAGHDAGVLAAELPTAMLFVRNPTGVSHSPAETASDDDCRAGADALATVLAALAGGLPYPPIALATMARASSWMAVRWSWPRKDSAYSL